MCREFPADLDIALTGLEVVDGAHVVQSPTCHKVPRWGIGTGHDPGGAQWDGMYLQEGWCGQRQEHLSPQMGREGQAQYPQGGQGDGGRGGRAGTLLVV